MKLQMRFCLEEDQMPRTNPKKVEGTHWCQTVRPAKFKCQTPK